MTIRKFDSQHDWIWIMRIETQCFPPPAQRWTRRMYEAALENGAHCYVTDDPVVGAVWFQGNEILSLGVLRKARGLHYGQRLMQRALDSIKACGHPRAQLDVRPSAVPALRMYLQLGFEVTHWDANYYEKGDGALHLVKRLR